MKQAIGSKSFLSRQVNRIDNLDIEICSESQYLPGSPSPLLRSQNGFSIARCHSHIFRKQFGLFRKRDDRPRDFPIGLSCPCQCGHPGRHRPARGGASDDSSSLATSRICSMSSLGILSSSERTSAAPRSSVPSSSNASLT